MSPRVIRGSPCLSWPLKQCVNKEWALWRSKRKPLHPPAELSVVLASQVFAGPCVSRLIPSLYLTLSAPGTTAQENNLSLLHKLFLEHHKSQIHRGWEMLAWLVGFLWEAQLAVPKSYVYFSKTSKRANNLRECIFTSVDGTKRQSLMHKLFNSSHDEINKLMLWYIIPNGKIIGCCRSCDLKAFIKHKNTHTH